MGQQHGIDHAALDRQVREVRDQVGPARPVEALGDHALAADMAGAQQLAPGAPGAELQQLEPENAVEGSGQQLRLGTYQRLAQRRGLPLLQHFDRPSRVYADRSIAAPPVPGQPVLGQKG